MGEGRGVEQDKQEILSLFVLSPVGVASFLLRQRVVDRQAVGSCLAWVRVEAFGSFCFCRGVVQQSFGSCLAQGSVLESCFVLEEI